MYTSCVIRRTSMINLLLSLVLLCPGSVWALIPEQCVHNATKSNAICCPPDPHNGLICGGSHRGFCQQIYAPKEPIPSIFRVDDRLQWPTRFIKYACQCKDRFFGVACEQCWFGWKGPNCDIPDFRIRRDIRRLSEHDLHIFIDVVARSQKWPSHYMVLDESDNKRVDPVKKPRFIPASVQYYMTFLHCYGSRTTLFKNKQKCEDYGILNFNHDGATFPTWHRYFILIWERMLGDIAWEVHGIRDYTLPYWDWVGLKECDICNNHFIGAPGVTDSDGTHIDAHHPFSNLTNFCWEPEVGTACYGCQKGGRFGKLVRKFTREDFPDQDDIRFMMSRKDYFVPGERDSPDCVSFHMALEGFCGRPGTDASALWTHNKVHVMIQGSMAGTATATNDPIFILHHAFIDKLYSMWYRKYRPPVTAYPAKGVRPGHAGDDFMVAIYPLARNSDMFVDTTALGYDHDDPDTVGFWEQNGKGLVIVH
ncbi:Tyrosinase [Fasciola hepatica]|uniref:Tyrosinase n=1 Tax=Fasciola hepatica TaxID=6192 RepID=A0A4E0RIA0_FASHE|nr:Tyrosinase [Fasciola hepatica]